MAPSASHKAPPGHGRRPQPRQLSSRLRFWPAAISSASVFTRHRRRKRKRRNPFQSLTSPLDGKQVYQAYLRRAKNRRDRYLEVYGDGWEGGYWEPIGPRFHLDLVESPS